MKANTKMNQLYTNGASDRRNDLLSFINNPDVLKPTFKCIHGCVVIDNEDRLNEDKVNIQRLISNYGDRTGFEASCNEVRINDYIDGGNLNDSDLVYLGTLIIIKWKEILSKTFMDDEFSFLMALSDGYLTLRFHKNRSDEEGWLNNDLEKYEEAVAIL